MISFSIDGINKQHDKIRNFPNGFNKLIKSIEEIKKLRKHHKNLKTFVITTYSKYNKDNILEITDYITNKLGLEMELNYVRGDTKNKEAKDITLANYIRAKRMIMKFNEKNAKKGFKERMLRSINNLCFNLVVKTERENKRIIPCFVGKKMIDIAEDGTIFPCEMMDINFGNIKDFDYDIKKILKSDRARNFFKFLKQKKCYCTWECAMKNNILYSPRHYPSLLKEWLKTFF